MNIESMGGGSIPTCAACEYLRRRCSPVCPLAPYFPVNQPKIFHNVHRLYGISNLTYILEKLPTTELKVDAMRSIIYECNMRERFPVHGCCGILTHLQKLLIAANQKLQFINAHLQACREQMVVHVCEQQQQHMDEDGGGQFFVNDGGDMMSMIQARMEAFGIQNARDDFDTEGQHVFHTEGQQFCIDVFNYDATS